MKLVKFMAEGSEANVSSYEQIILYNPNLFNITVHELCLIEYLDEQDKVQEKHWYDIGQIQAGGDTGCINFTLTDVENTNIRQRWSACVSGDNFTYVTKGYIDTRMEYLESGYAATMEFDMNKDICTFMPPVSPIVKVILAGKYKVLNTSTHEIAVQEIEAFKAFMAKVLLKRGRANRATSRLPNLIRHWSYVEDYGGTTLWAGPPSPYM